MTQDDFLFFRSWFEAYTKRFPQDDMEVEANLRYKKEHSLRVRDYMITLGEDLQLTTNQMLLAEVIGLFHDIGRFEQYTKYHTFKDFQSENHAKLGIEVLEREQVFSDRMSGQEVDLIFTAINNHNQRVIHKNVIGYTLLFCKLIRDADKLDILDQVINYYENPELTPYFAVERNHDDRTYSPEIIQGILNGEQISYASVKTPVDIKLIRLAWMLDLSFPTSFDIAKKKQFLARIRAFIPQTEETQRVFQYIEQNITDLESASTSVLTESRF